MWKLGQDEPNNGWPFTTLIGMMMIYGERLGAVEYDTYISDLKWVDAEKLDNLINERICDEDKILLLLRYGKRYSKRKIAKELHIDSKGIEQKIDRIKITLDLPPQSRG